MNEASVRIYRTSLRWRVATCVVTVPVIAGALFFLVAITVPLSGFEFFIRPPRWAYYLFGYAIGLGAIGLFAAATVSMLRYRVVLSSDAIEVSGAFRRRSLRKSDILAKELMFFGCTTYVLYPHDKKQSPLQVGVVFPTDERFRDWMSDIPARFGGPT